MVGSSPQLTGIPQEIDRRMVQLFAVLTEAPHAEPAPAPTPCAILAPQPLLSSNDAKRNWAHALPPSLGVSFNPLAGSRACQDVARSTGKVVQRNDPGNFVTSE